MVLVTRQPTTVVLSQKSNSEATAWYCSYITFRFLLSLRLHYVFHLRLTVRILIPQQCSVTHHGTLVLNL